MSTTASVNKAFVPGARTIHTVLSHVLPPLIIAVIGVIASGDGYLLQLATSAAIAYVLTASYNLIVGYAGIFSLAHVAIYGIGAYASIWFENHLSTTFWGSLVIVLVIGGVVGLLIAWPTAHLKGIFIAVATLGFAVATSEVINAWKDVTGGAGGLIDIKFPSLFGLELIGGTTPYYFLCGAVAWVVVEVCMRIDRSGTGRRLVALRENPRSLAAVGVKPARVRMLVFVVGSAFAAVAGSLFAHFQLAISPDSFDVSRLVELLLATLIGGAGKFYGPVVGVVAFVVLDEIGYSLGSGEILLYGLAIIVMLSLNSTGLVGVIESLVRRFQRPHGRPKQLPREEPAMPSDGRSGSVLLKADSVEVRFGGVVAVNAASLEVRSGEVVGLIGPNGAGKTTFFNAITGDVKIAKGSVEVLGAAVTGRPSFTIVKAGIARTFQSPSLVRDLSVIENVMLGGESEISATAVGEMLHTPTSVRDDAAQRTMAMTQLQRLGIAEYAYDIAGNLPYGVLRLTEIARNLMLDPAVLLLDEPGAGLTEDEREHLAGVLLAIAARGASVVLVDHNMSLITACCQRLVVVDHGVVLAQGETQEVLAHPDVVTAYLGGE